MYICDRFVRPTNTIQKLFDKTNSYVVRTRKLINLVFRNIGWEFAALTSAYDLVSNSCNCWKRTNQLYRVASQESWHWKKLRPTREVNWMFCLQARYMTCHLVIIPTFPTCTLSVIVTLLGEAPAPARPTASHSPPFLHRCSFTHELKAGPRSVSPSNNKLFESVYINYGNHQILKHY